MTQTTESLKSARAISARWSDTSQAAPSADASRREVANRDTDKIDAVQTEAGSWRLEGLLGEGTLSRVYAAQPAESAGRPAAYALKMLRPQWESRPEAIALLRREAAVGRQVAHPHLVAILGAHVLDSPYFVVMPRLAGETVSALLARKRTLSVIRALWIARQTAEALDALHRQNFLHGDVKPSNLQLAPTGHVTLLDLSFARAVSDESSAFGLSLVGTPNYMAPEQLGSTLRTDQRSDVYSLGATLYEMLAGEPPFMAADMAELIQLHRQSRPKPLRTLRADVPSPVAKLVADMLAKEPLRRPQSIEEVIGTLVRLEITEGVRTDRHLEPINFKPAA